jgi:hypothetical protein
VEPLRERRSMGWATAEPPDESEKPSPQGRPDWDCPDAENQLGAAAQSTRTWAWGPSTIC